MKTLPEIPLISEIRNLIHNGKFQDALSEISVQGCIDSDFTLEKARALQFLGRREEIETILLPVISDVSELASQRGVAHQILGHAVMEMGELGKAHENFERASELADVSGNLEGKLAANLFLSKIYTFEHKFPEGQFFLTEAFEDLKKLTSTRWLLGYYRHLSHFHFIGKNPLCVSYAYAGILMARMLKDPLFEYRGILELVLMVRMGQKILRVPDYELMVHFAKKSESDLLSWIKCVFDRAPPPNYSAKIYLGLASEAPQNFNFCSPRLEAAQFWILDESHGLLVDLQEEFITQISHGSPLMRILSVLNEALIAVPAPELFEKVWKLKWVPERHQHLLDVTLSRLTKLSKSLKVSRNFGAVALVHKGFIVQEKS